MGKLDLCRLFPSSPPGECAASPVHARGSNSGNENPDLNPKSEAFAQVTAVGSAGVSDTSHQFTATEKHQLQGGKHFAAHPHHNHDHHGFRASNDRHASSRQDTRQTVQTAQTAQTMQNSQARYPQSFRVERTAAPRVHSHRRDRRPHPAWEWLAACRSDWQARPRRVGRHVFVDPRTGQRFRLRMRWGRVVATAIALLLVFVVTGVGMHALVSGMAESAQASGTTGVSSSGKTNKTGSRVSKMRTGNARKGGSKSEGATKAAVKMPSTSPVPSAPLVPKPELDGETAPSGGLDGAVPEAGDGKFAPVSGELSGREGAQTVRFAVAVEGGLPIDARTAANTFYQILNDPRGWNQGGKIRFARTSKNPDVTVVLGSPTLIGKLCAPLDTQGDLNCRNGKIVAINAKRWLGGADLWRQAGKTNDQYRIYVASHEVGHFLGYGHLYECGPGRLAPTMMQQTGGMVNQCIPNGWPTLSTIEQK
ncbi:MAG: DUF3152 domain-containing protein [Actinomycetaceae bacterium]|nr:DUF3152 domain-containing protein [Actinomycetaceae bacterium]